VAQAPFLGAQVADVAHVGGGPQRLHPLDGDPGLLEAVDLVRVVGQQPHRHHTQLAQDIRGLGVAAVVDREPEAQVGVDRVRALVLLDVGPQLVDQPDPAALVPGGVEHHAAALGRDPAQRHPELDPAVAAQRGERVSGQALRVHPGQHGRAVGQVAPGQRQVHEPWSDLDGGDVELAELRRQHHADGSNTVWQPVTPGSSRV
jgi:hypothetical protein